MLRTSGYMGINCTSPEKMYEVTMNEVASMCDVTGGYLLKIVGLISKLSLTSTSFHPGDSALGR